MHVIDIYIHYTYITYIMFVFYSYGYRLSLRVIQLPKNEMKHSLMKLKIGLIPFSPTFLQISSQYCCH